MEDWQTDGDHGEVVEAGDVGGFSFVKFADGSIELFFPWGHPWISRLEGGEGLADRVAAMAPGPLSEPKTVIASVKPGGARGRVEYVSFGYAVEN